MSSHRMDPVSRSMSLGLAEDISSGEVQAHNQIVSCLRTRCQREIAKCRNGPCDLSKERLQARRFCRPLKKTIMDSLDAQCTARADKVSRNALRKRSTAITDPQESFRRLLVQCKHSEAELHPEYAECFENQLNIGMAKVCYW
uniref:Uncharacterized protein n=1 Tax=Octactis speculum TaxID=3111310 RepID=A0A7S2GFD5_9STRA